MTAGVGCHSGKAPPTADEAAHRRLVNGESLVAVQADALAIGALILLPTSYFMAKFLMLAPPVIPLLQQHQQHFQTVIEATMSATSNAGFVEKNIYGQMSMLVDAAYAGTAKLFAIQVSQ
jgi:hypothetical protein